MTEKHVMSHSQKELYKTCKRKWYHQYAEGIEDDKPASKALVFGSFVHEVLEQYMRERYDFFGTYTINKVALAMIIERVLVSLEGAEVLSANDKKLAYVLALQGLSVLKKNFEGLLLLQPNGKPAIELKLTHGDTYTGIIDLIYVDKLNQIVLLDWKTTSWGGAYTNHKIKQSKQLKGYAWLVKKELGLSVDMLAYCVLNKKEQTAHIMRVRNNEDYVDFEIELNKISRETKLFGGEFASSFQRNEESCFAYRSECPFYDLCWSQDTRNVETIDLVPSLG